MTAASPENADVTASLIALEALEMPDLRASHPAENLSSMGDTKSHAALIAVLIPSHAGWIALFHNHIAPCPTSWPTRTQLLKMSETTSHATPMTALMPFQAGAIALFHNQVAAVPIAVNASFRPGNTVVDSQFHTADIAVFIAAQVVWTIFRNVSLRL
ncbi:Uncharacterised protein [Mycobacteroides abscessus]|nr:Uncharacterised protein [Mycobacteroides abscessus]SKE05355.1 Uncharacterised protein [Mycobacteroides abscessus subsp. massiliense]CPV13616.1 Uncharacterised protein [Mycobacteroides abscessus]CPV59643.1 Uncharacterised protein [Mycobacteroides abscessus]CPV65130.1 Uncharacterised protein [Mycobacteroides abscessus]